uniref:Lon protease homolog n=1 Tax=Toxoplasma gondii (strain ATCC 50861 / VEG) TaxID=432359 RepID=A0A0F7V3Y7_TOXGV|nr:TPA: lon protease, putative [Toxoplasma gondii VEG]
MAHPARLHKAPGVASSCSSSASRTCISLTSRRPPFARCFYPSLGAAFSLLPNRSRQDTVAFLQEKGKNWRPQAFSPASVRSFVSLSRTGTALAQQPRFFVSRRLPPSPGFSGRSLRKQPTHPSGGGNVQTDFLFSRFPVSPFSVLSSSLSLSSLSLSSLSPSSLSPSSLSPSSLSPSSLSPSSLSPSSLSPSSLSPSSLSPPSLSPSSLSHFSVSPSRSVCPRFQPFSRLAHDAYVARECLPPTRRTSARHSFSHSPSSFVSVSSLSGASVVFAEAPLSPLAFSPRSWEIFSVPSARRESRSLSSGAHGPRRREEDWREEKAEPATEARDSDNLSGEAERPGHRDSPQRQIEKTEAPEPVPVVAEKRGKALQDFLGPSGGTQGEVEQQRHSSAASAHSSEETLHPTGEVTQIDVRDLPSSGQGLLKQMEDNPASPVRVGRRRRGATISERGYKAQKLQRPETAEGQTEETTFRRSEKRATDEAEEAQAVLLRGDSAPASLSSHNISSALSALPPRFSVLTALPLFRRPAFPGFFQLLHIPDNDVFEALVRQKKSGMPGGDYVAGFLTIEEKEKEHEEDEEGPGAKLRKDAGRVVDISELHTTGSLLHLLNFAPHSNVRGGQVVVMPYRRIRLLGAADSPASSSPPTDTSPSLPHASTHSGGAAASSTSSASAEVLNTPAESLQREMEKDEEVSLTSKAEEEDQVLREGAGTSRPAVGDQGAAASGVSPDKEAEEPPFSSPNSDAEQMQGTQNKGKTGEPSPSSSSSSSLSPVKTATFSLLRVRIAYLPDESGRFDVNDTQKALHLEIIATMKELLKQSYFYKEHFDQVVRFYNLDSPHKLADLVAGMSFGKRQELQAVLAEEDIEKRLRLVLEIAKKDLEFSKLQAQVKAQVEEKMNKMQRKFLLSEQLKFLKRELGEVKDDKESILDSFAERLEKKKHALPEEVQKAVAYELSKLHSLEQSSSEFNITRTYTDCLLSLPWGEYTEDCSDIFVAEQILNEDHYGLADVKDRILEFIAVTILRKDVQGKIICLVGPPGVGKTSVGQSIARALHRKFYRISLGGMCDVAELRGHRRTYISALPGKVIQALKECQTMNPVILLDEIDKLGRDFRGDPSSALLEILDPRPLLDRMEVIRIAGYIFQEKLCIARNYLLPQTSQSAGLTDDQISISSEVLEKLVRDYAREAGVRSLLKLIERIYRKAALSLVRKEQEKVEVHMDNLSKFVGQPTFQSDRLYGETPPGVVMGLAWTQMGGATLYVEAIGRRPRDTSKRVEMERKNWRLADDDEACRREKRGRTEQRSRSPAGAEGRLKVTGQLGNVMSESSEIALTFCRVFVRRIEPRNSFLETAQIHLHVPEGATPKDGPSAGVTMATALVSLALNKPVLPDVAMTGELTLTGKVLKIGGVKEKVIAARRENVNTLIFPQANEREFSELPDDVKEGLSVHFASTYDDVYRVAFGAEPPSRT